MKLSRIVFAFIVSFLFSFSVFAQEAVTTSAPLEVAPVVAEEVTPEDCPFKSMMKGKHSMYSKGWHNKTVGQMVAYKSLKGVCMLVFLFLGAFVVRKGWTLGGKK
jgi:hypothetical protein